MLSSLLPLIQGGGIVAGSVVVTYLMVTDRLMGKRSVDRMLEGYRTQITYLVGSSSDDQATITLLVQQNAKLQLQGELAVALLQSLQSMNATTTKRDRNVAPKD